MSSLYVSFFEFIVFPFQKQSLYSVILLRRAIFILREAEARRLAEKKERSLPENFYLQSHAHNKKRQSRKFSIRSQKNERENA